LSEKTPIFSKRQKYVLKGLVVILIAISINVSLNYFSPPRQCREPTGILLRTVDVVPSLQNFTFTERGITIAYNKFSTFGTFTYLGYTGSGPAPSIIMIYETHPHTQRYLNAHAACADAIWLNWQDTFSLSFYDQKVGAITYTVQILIH